MADGAPLLKYYPERSVDDAINLHLETGFDNAILLSIPLYLITVLFLPASLTSLPLLSLKTFSQAISISSLLAGLAKPQHIQHYSPLHLP